MSRVAHHHVQRVGDATTSVACTVCPAQVNELCVNEKGNVRKQVHPARMRRLRREFIEGRR